MRGAPLSRTARGWHAAVLSLLLAACGAPESVQRFELKGKVVALQKGPTNILFVSHEPIPGFMDHPMTMGFTVAGGERLDRLRQGDRIRADLEVTQGRTTLRNIVVLEEGAPSQPASAAQPIRQPQPGDVVPNFVLRNQYGKLTRLHDYHGKAVLLTFIYTRCPLPDYCPRMNDNFVEIEKALSKEPNALASTHLLSLSFDPAYDSPEVLRSYSASYISRAGVGALHHWEFAAVPKKNLAEAVRFFGLSLFEEQGQIVHSMSTAIISKDGKIYSWYRGNSWQSKDVLRDLLAAAQQKPVAEAVR